MARFVVNSRRHDPYKNFKFRVIINGKVVGGVTELTLIDDAPVKKIKRKLPGLQKFQNITMKRGLFGTTKFYRWMAAIPGSKKFPSDIVIEQFDGKGKLVAAYNFTNAWPFKVEGPSLKADGNELTVECIELSHEGLEIINC